MRNNSYNSRRKYNEVWKKRGDDKSQKKNSERKGPTIRLPHGKICRRKIEMKNKKDDEHWSRVQLVTSIARYEVKCVMLKLGSNVNIIPNKSQEMMGSPRLV